jgi:predicted O-methyltransferase YrrM
MEDDTKDFNSIAQSALDAPFYAQQKRTELTQLLEFLSKYDLKNILELGVFKGGTIKAWTNISNKRAIITGVDLPEGKYGGGFNPEEQKQIEKLAIGEQKIGLFALDTHLKSTLKIIKEYAPFDFLFIDADHTYEGVKVDFDLYSPLVRKGGFIALHDIVKHTKYPEVEVYKLWNEIKNKYNYKEFIDLEYPTDHGLWGGIGLIEI